MTSLAGWTLDTWLVRGVSVAVAVAAFLPLTTTYVDVAKMKIQGQLIKPTFLLRLLIFSRAVGRSDSNGGIINWRLTQPPTHLLRILLCKILQHSAALPSSQQHQSAWPLESIPNEPDSKPPFSTSTRKQLLCNLVPASSCGAPLRNSTSNNSSLVRN